MYLLIHEFFYYNYFIIINDLLHKNKSQNIINKRKIENNLKFN